MIRFAALERLGVRVAAMSDLGDGDLALDGNAAELARFCAGCGVDPARLTRVRQVHGARVALANGRGAGGTEADGLASAAPGEALGITIADCVPVFLAAEEGAAVGLLHAGREGTRANIAGAGVAFLAAHCGAAPTTLHAVIGPSAGPCCYEVSETMAAAFAAAGGVRTGRRLDLWETNARQLRAAGLPPGQVHVAGECTICGGRFHSHRRAPGRGRNLALIMR